MKITIETDNCDRSYHHLPRKNIRSSITLRLETLQPISVQSRRTRLEQLRESIQHELSKFIWQIFGEVTVEMCWYLCPAKRRETDKTGDLDNISKPLIDSLCGPDGILIDDSQIASMGTMWLSKDDKFNKEILILRISFNNEECIEREKILFIKYHKALCMITEIDIMDPLGRDFVLKLLDAKKKARILAEKVGFEGFVKCNMLPDPSYDFHRTRLQEFDPERILEIKCLIDMSCQGD